MPQIEALDVADLVAATLRDLGRMSFQQIAQSKTDYEIYNYWFKEDKVMFDDGIGIQRTLMSRLPTAARHVGWMDEDVANMEDLLDQIQIPWRHVTTNWSFTRQEALMNRGKSLIVNLIEPKRVGALTNLVETIETEGWSSPASSSDKTLPHGVSYWVTKNTATGFNGGAATGHTTVGGVSLTDSPNFKNYTVSYALMTKGDAIKKMRTMARKIKFKPPVSAKDYRTGRGERYRLYVNETTMSTMEDVGESQNENLGRDIASVDGVDLAFRRHPIRWAEALDADTSNPVYMLDHSTFYPVCLKGDYLHEEPPTKSPKQHNVYTVHVDLTYNYLCIDRRRNGIAYIG